MYPPLQQSHDQRNEPPYRILLFLNLGFLKAFCFRESFFFKSGSPESFLHQRIPFFKSGIPESFLSQGIPFFKSAIPKSILPQGIILCKIFFLQNSLFKVWLCQNGRKYKNFGPFPILFKNATRHCILSIPSLKFEIKMLLIKLKKFYF